jgi:hypothetical protein
MVETVGHCAFTLPLPLLRTLRRSVDRARPLKERREETQRVPELHGTPGQVPSATNEADAVPFTWGRAPGEWPHVPSEASGTFDGPPTTDRLAVAALASSLAGFVTGFTALLGIVFGLVARHRIALSGGATKGRGLALSGILIGIGGIAWTVVVAEVAIRAADDASINLAWSEVLPSSAYPHGWTGQGQELENDDANYFTLYLSPGEVRQVASCLHMSPTNIETDPTEAASQEYGTPSYSFTATDTVDVFSSTAAATADAVASGKANAMHCEINVPDQSRYVGYHDNTLTSRERTIPPLGDHDSDVELRSTDPNDPGTVFFDDFITVQEGPSESNLVLSTYGAPPPATLVDRLAAAAAQRLTDH